MRRSYLISTSFMAVSMIIAVVTIAAKPIIQNAGAASDYLLERSRAPIATSGDNNVYVAWWSNKTGVDKVMFKASTDGGKSRSNKMIISNAPNANSQDVQIAASSSNVYVSWWERNQTSNEPVMRISDDNGKSFGPVLHLAANGTIGSSG